MQHTPPRDPTFQYQPLLPSLKDIGKKMPNIESENKFLTSIKGYNSVLIRQNLPVCNPDPHTKFEDYRLTNAKNRECKPISNVSQRP